MMVLMAFVSNDANELISGQLYVVWIQTVVECSVFKWYNNTFMSLLLMTNAMKGHSI